MAVGHSVKAETDKRPFQADTFPVIMVIEKVVAHATSAEHALSQIGGHWDTAKYGETVDGYYQFEIDGHRFKLTIEPTDDQLWRNEVIGKTDHAA